MSWRRFLASRDGDLPEPDDEPDAGLKKEAKYASTEGNGDHRSLTANDADRPEKKSPYAVGEQAVERHYRRQVIHRSVTSAMIGLVGLLFIASYFVTNPTVYAWGLFAVVIIILLVFISAIADALRTQLFFQRNDQGFRDARQELITEYHRLKAKERKLKAAADEDRVDEN